MMKTEKIFNENGSGFIRVFASDKVEKVNLVEYYKTVELKQGATLIRDLLYSTKSPLLTSFLDSDYIEKEAKKWSLNIATNVKKQKYTKILLSYYKLNRRKTKLDY